MRVLHPSLNCFSLIHPFLDFCTVFDHIFGIRLGALEMCYILVLSKNPPRNRQSSSHSEI